MAKTDTDPSNRPVASLIAHETKGVVGPEAELVELVWTKLEKALELDLANVTRAVHLMTVAKAIERAADHVQNIAEEVFYLYSGQDIRHEPGV